jgi:hypothetical protein
MAVIQGLPSLFINNNLFLYLLGTLMASSLVKMFIGATGLVGWMVL